MKRVLEILPKSKKDLGKGQRSKLNASIEVAVDISKIKRGINLVDTAYFINMRDNEKIDYDIVKEVCEEYVKEKNINAFV
jgi:hypothetical protein